MLSSFCHCLASLSIPVAFWSAHVSPCQNKRILQPSHQPQEPEPRDEQRDLYHRRWAVAGETRSQTASHSSSPAQRDIEKHRDKHLGLLSIEVSAVPTPFYGMLQPDAPAPLCSNSQSAGCKDTVMNLSEFSFNIHNDGVFKFSWRQKGLVKYIQIYSTGTSKNALKQALTSNKSQCLTLKIPNVIFKSKTPTSTDCVIDLVSCVSSEQKRQTQQYWSR